MNRVFTSGLALVMALGFPGGGFSAERTTQPAVLNLATAAFIKDCGDAGGIVGKQGDGTTSCTISAVSTGGNPPIDIVYGCTTKLSLAGLILLPTQGLSTAGGDKTFGSGDPLKGLNVTSTGGGGC